MFAQRFQINRLAFLRRDECHRRLTFARVRAADHGALFHTGKAVDHLLDLARVDVHSMDQQHVLEPINDVQISIAVHPSQVARMKPAVADCFCGFIGIVKVAAHHVRTADADLAHFARRKHPAAFVADRNLDVFDRHAARALLLDAAQRIEADDGRCLG